jgi:hypothetical protein
MHFLEDFTSYSADCEREIDEELRYKGHLSSMGGSEEICYGVELQTMKNLSQSSGQTVSVALALASQSGLEHRISRLLPQALPRRDPGGCALSVAAQPSAKIGPVYSQPNSARNHRSRGTDTQHGHSDRSMVAEAFRHPAAGVVPAR